VLGKDSDLRVFLESDSFALDVGLSHLFRRDFLFTRF
jgi:hypothetical protein